MSGFFDKYAAEIFALINLIAAGVLLPMLRGVLEQYMTTKRADRVEIAINNGLKAAIAALTKGKDVPGTLLSVMNDTKVRQSVVDLAQDYVHDTVPTALQKLGIEDSLSQVVSARVEHALAELAQQYITTNKAIAVDQATNSGGGYVSEATVAVVKSA